MAGYGSFGGMNPREKSKKKNDKAREMAITRRLKVTMKGGDSSAKKKSTSEEDKKKKNKSVGY